MASRSDNFTRADQTNGFGTPSDGGSAWVDLAGTAGITGNRGYYPAPDLNNTVSYLEAGTSSVQVDLTVSTFAGGNCGPAARIVDANNLLMFAFVGGVYYLYKSVAGSYTQLGTIAGSLVSGDAVSIRVDSSHAIRCYQNGTLRIGPVTDATNSAGTKVGLRSANDPSSRFGAFTATDLSAGGAQTLAPTGIGSAEAFGSATVQRGAVGVAPTGIASAEAMGVPSVLPGPIDVLPPGIASGAALGVPTLQPGAVGIAPSGIASAEVFGPAYVSSGGIVLQPAGIASAEAFGSPTLAPGGVPVSPPGIASAEAFGNPVVSAGGALILAPGIPGAEGFGLPVVTPGATAIAPPGIASAEAFGAAVVATATGLSILATGIASAEAFGLPTIGGGALPSTLRQALYALLRADSGLAAQVGRRIYPGSLPQGVDPPALVYAIPSGRDGRYLDGAGDGTREARVQVECWGRRVSECVTLAERVGAILAPEDDGSAPDRYWSTVRIRRCRRDDEQEQSEPEPGGSDRKRWVLLEEFLVSYYPR